jgi:hypothetical protein
MFTECSLNYYTAGGGVAARPAGADREVVRHAGAVPPVHSTEIRQPGHAAPLRDTSGILDIYLDIWIEFNSHAGAVPPLHSTEIRQPGHAALLT